MKFNKTAGFLCSSALLLSFAGMYCTADAAETKDTVRIMSIGDSITDGYGTEGSYRKFLCHELTEAGYTVDMVGPNASWGDAEYTGSDGEKFTYDPAHCGYSGYAIEEYPGRNGIRETITKGGYLAEYKPDIVILQIGTNDIIDNHEIDTAGKRLDTLVTYILDNISEDSALFVTTIPDLEPNREDVYQWFANYRHSADWQTQYSDEDAAKTVSAQIINYNSQVSALVESKKNSGVKNIYFGDVHSAVTDTAAQLKDGVHPNDEGYKAMGEYWTGKLLAYLGGTSSDPSDNPPVQTPTEQPPAENPPSETPTEQPSDTPPAELPAEQPSAEPELIFGDVNGDKAVNAIDFILLQKYMLGSEDIEGFNISGSDLNGDGAVTILDFIKLKETLLKQII